MQYHGMHTSPMSHCFHHCTRQQTSAPSPLILQRLCRLCDIYCMGTVLLISLHATELNIKGKLSTSLNLRLNKPHEQPAHFNAAETLLSVNYGPYHSTGVHVPLSVYEGMWYSHILCTLVFSGKYKVQGSWNITHDVCFNINPRLCNVPCK
jgi:hypothetical protein